MFGCGYAYQLLEKCVKMYKCWAESQMWPIDLEAGFWWLTFWLGLQVNGSKLEASVREREKDNPRFAFLHPGHVYHHAYR